MQDSILTTVVKDIDGEVTTLEKFAGNVLLIVNVASKCGAAHEQPGRQEHQVRPF
jgi:glutathione peroxidase